MSFSERDGSMSKSYFILSEEKEPQLFKLMKDYSLAVGVCFFITDINGYQQSEIPESHSLCEMIQSTAKEKAACENCQMHQMIYPIKRRSINKYLCHAGFTHVPLPVYINNILVGYLIIGRLVEAQNRHLIEKNQSSNVSEELRMTTYFSAERLEKIIELFVSLAQSTLTNSNPKRKIDVGQLRYVNERVEILPKKTEIVNAVKYIEKNLHRKICLEEVANKVYLSQYYFSKLFKKELGMNFVAYLKYQRVTKAKELLRHSNLSIDEIARRVGFSQTSYFCKSFRDITSKSPSSFRKEINSENSQPLKQTMTV